MVIGHRTFRPGAYINKQGHPANVLYFIVRGTVVVYKVIAFPESCPVSALLASMVSIIEWLIH